MGACFRKHQKNENDNIDNSIETNDVVMYISEHGFENSNIGADENLSKSSPSSSSNSPIKIISSLWLSEKSKGKIKNIGNDDEKQGKNKNIEIGLQIKLLEHKHTLFCERKQRVCDAYGKIQELEILQIQNLDEKGNKLDISFNNSLWLRSKNISDEFIIIEGTQNKNEYTLTKEDVGCFINFKYMLDNNNNDYNIVKSIGPVLPGPPRLLEIRIIGETKIGNRIIATSKYIGGYEGKSEYWWIRIKDGEREQITEPRAINIENLYQEAFILPENDPRVHIITNEDKGCCFKVKCRPVRSDGYKGEIVTSLQSDIAEI